MHYVVSLQWDKDIKWKYSRFPILENDDDDKTFYLLFQIYTIARFCIK